MKKILSMVLLLGLLLFLYACEGNFGSVDLQEPIPIGEDGRIEEKIIKQLRQENAIGIFIGQSNGLRYEWTVFGSDVSSVRSVNLAVTLEKEENSIRVSFGQKEAFGFPGLLSIYLDEKWEAQGATAYRGQLAAASVSITGSSQTILNLSVDGTLGEVVIRPDAMPEETVPESTPPASVAGGGDEYLSGVTGGEEQVYTDGKDKYQTDPIPEGKPKPVEPEDQEVDKGNTYQCTFSIDCATILNNLDQLDPEKLELVPSDGVILATTTVTFYEGESVFDVLQRLCKEKKIHMEFSWTPIYNSCYIEGISNFYEFDCGSLSGWMYRVNGWYPNYGCSRYQLQDGDVVQWRYTCDLGNDVGRTGSW